MSSETGRRPSGRFAPVSAVVLLLVTPFVVFLRHHVYDLARPEMLAVLLGLAGLGLLLGLVAARSHVSASVVIAAATVLAVDLQFDFDVPVPGVGETAALAALFVVLGTAIYGMGPAAIALIQVMAAVVLVTTFLVPRGTLGSHEILPVAGNPRGEAPPFYLHVIFDEHIGLEGLPLESTGQVGRELRAFLESNGFYVFGGAYSEYASTAPALAHLLNLTTRKYDSRLVGDARAPFTGVLTRNLYFEWLSERGYRLSVYQPDYLDLCHSSVPVAACRTYASTRLGILQDVPLSPAQKASVVVGAYLMRADIWNELRELYTLLREWVHGRVALPAWNWEPPARGAGPIATAALLERLSADLTTARRGEAVVAHLLLPHFPYVFDASCELLPPREWLERYDATLKQVRNTRETRALRYARYSDQLRCTQRWVARLLAAIPEEVRRDAVVVLQGDHGSRITLVDPSERNRDRLVASDYVDNYSTLFAVRSPAIGAGYTSRQSSSACILEALADSGFGSTAAADACTNPPTVLWQIDDTRHAERPLPPFTASTAPAPGAGAPREDGGTAGAAPSAPSSGHGGQLRLDDPVRRDFR